MLPFLTKHMCVHELMCDRKNKQPTASDLAICAQVSAPVSYGGDLRFVGLAWGERCVLVGPEICPDRVSNQLSMILYLKMELPVPAL